MYKHEVEPAINENKKVRRGSWAKGTHLVKLPEGPGELTKEELKLAGLSAGADIHIAEQFLLCEGKSKATYGYQLTSEDNNAQDWEIL